MIHPVDIRERVPNPVVERLSVYAKVLMTMLQEGEALTSSAGLSARIGFSAAQIRRDLTVFGQFGTKGRGYDVSELHGRLARILGIDVERRVVIIGAGNLAAALIGYSGFREHNFRVVAAFDIAPDRVDANTQDGVAVHHMDDLGAVVADETVEVAILTVPAAAARSALDAVVSAGIRAVLNFAPTPLGAHPGVRIRNVNLSVEMETLCFDLGGAPRHAPTGASRRDEAGADQCVGDRHGSRPIDERANQTSADI